MLLNPCFRDVSRDHQRRNGEHLDYYPEELWLQYFEKPPVPYAVRNLSVNLQNNCRDNPKQGAEFSGYYCVSGLCPRYGWSDWDHEYPAGTSDELPEFGFVINAQN